MRHRFTHHPVTRAVALLAAMGVLMVAMVAASPSLHAWLHARNTSTAAVGHDHHHHEHDHDSDHRPGEPVGSPGHVCAITLFAGGFLPLLIAGLAVSGLRWSGEFVLRVAAQIAAPFPADRLAPSRAPPLA